MPELERFERLRPELRRVLGYTVGQELERQVVATRIRVYRDALISAGVSPAHAARLVRVLVEAEPAFGTPRAELVEETVDMVLGIVGGWLDVAEATDRLKEAAARV